jgi:Ca2+-dependent lipid-binding protein
LHRYCGSETHKTSVKSGAGTNPVWNEVLQFGQKGDTLKIVVKDDDVFKDDEVGSGSFNIAPAYNNPGKPATSTIMLLFSSN